MTDRGTSGGMEITSTGLLAFTTSALGTTCNVWAKTRGKARWATVLAARDAGYRCEMTDVSCKRAPGLDNATEADRQPIKENHCYATDAVYKKSQRRDHMRNEVKSGESHCYPALLSCPFCGERAVYSIPVPDQMHEIGRVVCEGCGITTDFIRPLKAAAKWNRRVDNARSHVPSDSEVT